MRVERERTVLETGQATREAACRLASLGADQAGPDEIGRFVRGHWEVENRRHCGRDFRCDEDRCRATARNLAAFRNAAISIVRVLGRFRYIPPAPLPPCPIATTPPARRRPWTPCGPPEAPGPAHPQAAVLRHRLRRTTPHSMSAECNASSPSI